MSAELLKVHPLLSDRVRLAIMASLLAEGKSPDFNSLLERLAITRGNLSTHMTKLENAQLVLVTKEFVGKKPCTTYALTGSGKKAVTEYLEIVEQALKGVRG